MAAGGAEAVYDSNVLVIEKASSDGEYGITIVLGYTADDLTMALHCEKKSGG